MLLCFQVHWWAAWPVLIDPPFWIMEQELRMGWKPKQFLALEMQKMCLEN